MGFKEIGGPVRLDVPTDPACFFLVRCLVEKLALQLDFSREEVQRMVLAVDEACSNIVRHAYKNHRDQRFELTFSASADRLEIEIRDFASPTDPSTFTMRDPREVRPGGLGIHFIRSAMDEVRYEIPEGGGGMLLRLVKYRKTEVKGS